MSGAERGRGNTPELTVVLNLNLVGIKDHFGNLMESFSISQKNTYHYRYITFCQHLGGSEKVFSENLRPK